MLRTLALTATAALAALTAATMPAANATTPDTASVTVHDPRGDVDTFGHKKAPRQSIDITKVTATPVTVQGQHGYRYTIKVKDLFVPADAFTLHPKKHPFKQWFAIGVYGKDKADLGTTVTFSVYDHPRSYGDSSLHTHACPNAVLAFDKSENTVTAFIPNACVGKVQVRTAVGTLLYGKHNQVFAYDKTRQFAF